MKNVIITGANSGLGLETAKKIAKASPEYRVILACRNMEKAEAAKAEVIYYSGNGGKRQNFCDEQRYARPVQHEAPLDWCGSTGASG